MQQMTLTLIIKRAKVHNTARRILSRPVSVTQFNILVYIASTVAGSVQSVTPRDKLAMPLSIVP